MDEFYKNIEYNPNKWCKIFVVFDEMIPDMFIKKNFYQNYLSAKILVFISQSSFDVSKINRLNSTHYFIMKNQTELQQNVIDHSSDIDFKYFL